MPECIVLWIYIFGYHSHSLKLSCTQRNTLYNPGAFAFQLLVHVFNVRFQTFFFSLVRICKEAKRFIQAFLRFPSSLPCTQGGPTFYMQKLHSNLKHLIPIHSFKKIFFLNLCIFVTHCKTTDHIFCWYLKLSYK